MELYQLDLPTISLASCDEMMIPSCERLLMPCHSCADIAIGPTDTGPRNNLNR